MKILFCSDGSSQAERAIRFGARIAFACQAEPAILGIAENRGDEDCLKEAFHESQGFFKKHHLDLQVIIEAGQTVKEIVKHCKRGAYDLVVVGATPKSNFWRSLDPVSMSVRVHTILESVEIPVLVVVGERPALRRILLCSGGAEYINKAIKFAGNIARCTKAVVDLFHVMPETPAIYTDLSQFNGSAASLLESNSKLGRALRHQKELLDQFGVFGEIRLRQGQVVPELLKELQENRYDLLVAGSSPAEDFLTRYVVSDVTREIVVRTLLPVLVIRTKPRRIHRFFKKVVNRLLKWSN